MNKLWEIFSKWSTTIIFCVLLLSVDFSEPIDPIHFSVMFLFMGWLLDTVLFALKQEAEQENDNIH